MPIMIFFRCFFLLLFIAGCSQNKIPYQQQAPVIEKIAFAPLPPQINPPKNLIIIDPGHGGEDKGTLSLLKPVYQEKHFTLITAKILKDYLQNLGHQVKMTRSEDIFIPLSKRAEIANEANARLFVSIHYNSAPSIEAKGIEVFYYKSETDILRTNTSKDLAKDVLDSLISFSKAKSRGVKAGNYAVIRETKMPAILVEGGFLTNEEELQKIKDPQYLKQIAWGIAQGIDQHLKKN